ncbi:MAG: stage III sporulation protein AA [Limnochordia bacterium]|jgi:stage III sporulation protein AA
MDSQPSVRQLLERDIFPVLPGPLRDLVVALDDEILHGLEEIRLRVERPVMIVTGGKDAFLGAKGIGLDPNKVHRLSKEELDRVVQLLTKGSLYALEEELRNGYITLPGGHRVGLVGQAVMDSGRLKTIKHISGINLRLSRQVIGAANGVLPFLVEGKEVCQTLIISPPVCGKTTLLRDMARQLSWGVASLGLPGRQVAIADERSEIAGCYRGIPQLDVGPRTDVLDGCPKAEGMMILLRSMSPQVLITDEIGRPEDGAALAEAANCGVAVIATAHGRNLDEVRRRPLMAVLLAEQPFRRVVVLSRRQGVGTVEEILSL